MKNSRRPSIQDFVTLEEAEEEVRQLESMIKFQISEANGVYIHGGAQEIDRKLLQAKKRVFQMKENGRSHFPVYA